MRVLLVNPEMPPSYWTLRQTCRLQGCKTVSPPLGLITVAALLPQEWELRLADLDARPMKEDDWQWAEMVMFTGMIVQRQNLLNLIREAKQRGKTVVVGGPYPTSMPEEVLDAGCDFLVRGEAENTIAFFLDALKKGETGGVFQNREKPDLTTSPVPRFDLLHLNDYVLLSVQTSRGCPFDCEFCDVVSLYGRKPRYKEPRQVLAELTAIQRLGWQREIFFCDDNFIGNKAHARKILDRLIPWSESNGSPYSFWTQTSVNLGHDRAMIDLLTRANFSNVFIGIESPDEDVLALTGKHQNIRHPLEETLNNIRDNGLNVVGSFIIGFDGEKPGAGERIGSLVEATNIPVVMLNLLQPPPHTKLWRRLEKEGRLLEGRLHEAGTNLDSTGGRLIYLPTRPEEQIMSEYFYLWDYLYEPSRFLARTYRYILAMRPTRRALAQSRGEPVTDGHPRRTLPLKQRLKNLVQFLAISWRQGGCPSYRWQYWRQLLGIYRNNPSRLVKYIGICGIGEDMFSLRETLRRKMWPGDSAGDPKERGQARSQGRK
ncbi:MAG: radical SAM protein [Thermodesulfobacteriota bacterium]